MATTASQSNNQSNPPILRHKQYNKPSIFTPENLLREARRQKAIPNGMTPTICVLDPDGDIVRNLLATNQARLNPHWACYHTQMYDFEYGGIKFGIVGCVVEASFAVLVAAEMFASRCKLLVSLTSSGQVRSHRQKTRHILLRFAASLLSALPTSQTRWALLKKTLERAKLTAAVTL